MGREEFTQPRQSRLRRSNGRYSKWRYTIITNERNNMTTELLAGMPHSLLLSNSNGEVSVLVPAVLPVRPMILTIPFSTELVLDRSAKLDDLEDASESLADGARQFRNGAKKLSRQVWWQNMKWKLAGYSVLAIMLAIICWKLFA